jgi:hypothetical protein
MEQMKTEVEECLAGRLVWAGNLTVNGEEMKGVAVEIAPENLAGKSLPMYEGVAIVPVADYEGLFEIAMAAKEVVPCVSELVEASREVLEMMARKPGGKDMKDIARVFGRLHCAL